MTNKNYVKGRRKEYTVRKFLQSKKWITLRTAGSHGFADLIAVKKGRIRFIQCKPDNFGKKAQQMLEEEWAWINDEFLCSFEVI